MIAVYCFAMNHNTILFIFLLGILHDILFMLPLGVTSLMYIIANSISRNCKGKVLDSNYTSKVFIFGFMIFITSFLSYFLVSFHMGSFLDIKQFVAEVVITAATYYILLKVKFIFSD